MLRDAGQDKRLLIKPYDHTYRQYSRLRARSHAYRNAALVAFPISSILFWKG